MLHRSLKFIGAEPNDCVQFPDNHWNFQVIQLDTCSPKILKCQKKRLFVWLHLSILHNIFQTFRNGIQNLYWISWLILFLPNPKKIIGTNAKSCYKRLYFWTHVYLHIKKMRLKRLLTSQNLHFKSRNWNNFLIRMIFPRINIGEMRQPLFYLLDFVTNTCRLQRSMKSVTSCPQDTGTAYDDQKNL